MRIAIVFVALAAAVTAVPLDAQNLCPCVPTAHLWTVKTCSDWTCAATEIAVGNGDPQVIAMPVGIDDQRWLIVRRFTTGSAIDSGDDPFKLEQFDGMAGAAVRFAGFNHDQRPMLLTAPDGQVLVIALRQPEPRRRAAGR